jgi:drug/metabolite transporter (DMT)-like permease
MEFYERLFGTGTRRGVASMTLSMMLFIVNDSLVKVVSASLGAGQLIAIRGLIASLIVLAIIAGTGAARHLRRAWSGPAVWRGVLDMVGSLLYLLALFHMPIGNATAINMTSPLGMTAAAALFLQESVGWRRWSAVVVGFCGVLMVVQPRADGFNYWSLLAIGAVFFVVARDLMTRRMRADIPSLIIVLSASVVVMLGALGFSLVEGWKPVAGADVALLSLAAAFVIGGYYLIVDAMRHGALSVVGPFRYTALIWALLSGYLVWGDVPNLLAISGIAVIVGSGLYVLHRERVGR